MIIPIPTLYWYLSDVAEVSCTCYVAYVVSLHYGITFLQVHTHFRISAVHVII